jgi:antirestriction protein ArdC
MRPGNRGNERRNVYDVVIEGIIKGLEGGVEKWKKPWRGLAIPINASSKRQYNGINVLYLWAVAKAKGYKSKEWATYKQWQEKGGQVKKGEEAAYIKYWQQGKVESWINEEGEEEKGRTKVIVKGFCVFNGEQVEGYKEIEAEEVTEEVRNTKAEEFFRNLQAKVEYGGDIAAYYPSKDVIVMPEYKEFESGDKFYGVLAHEHIHWTGSERRCGRDLRGKFGSESYAMEELVAEIGAAYICAILGIEEEPRADHAAYIESWLRILKKDKGAIFSAASAAQKAVSWMQEQQIEKERKELEQAA